MCFLGKCCLEPQSRLSYEIVDFELKIHFDAYLAFLIVNYSIIPYSPMYKYCNIIISSLILCSFLIISEASAFVSQPPIISRAQRWADESLRRGNGPASSKPDESKWSDSTIITPAQKRSIADNYLVSNFPLEFKTDSIIRTWNDKSLLRPVQINNNKFKIVIHHTARAPQTNSYEDVITELQDIYRFHTVNRRWGDIGYNYIIWPNGEIFEGRAGGPSAVWAHAVNNNGWSIGISLMGNFDITEPSPEQLQAVIDLTARLTQTYKIDVYKQVSYHEASKEDPYISDHIDDSLVWHKDTWDTACPGKNLHNKLWTIKSQVSQLVWWTSLTDPTPVVTDPVKYYIPSTSYQLSIPWTKTTSITSCETNNTTRTIKKCTLSKWYLTLNLNKLTNQSHQWTHRLTLQTPQGQIYLYLSLEYRPTTTQLTNIKSISSTNKRYQWSKLTVMLYGLSTTSNLWSVSCPQWCSITLGTRSVDLPAGITFQLSRISKTNQLIFRWNNKKYYIPSIDITAQGSGVIMVNNYTRTQWDVNLNTWKGTLTRSTSSWKPIWQDATTGIIVHNIVRIDDYMRGLVLTQANTPQSYHDALYLAANTNTRYRWPNLTDDIRIHQFYGGAAAQHLDYKRQLSHDLYYDQVLYNDKNLTYAPVFECSDGITRNGVGDIGVCSNGALSWPGIWLSRKWALMLSQRWYNTRQIIEYYYPGIRIGWL